MGDVDADHGDPLTWFAPASRASPEEFQREVGILNRNALVDNLMVLAQGLVAVLNEHRQILAVNNALLTALGLEDIGPLRGLRVGEAVGCVYANQAPGGCGTSKFCRTCAAVCAMVACLKSNQVVETECAIAARREGKPTDFYFQIRCAPVNFDGQRFLLLFLRDISVDQQRVALERVFYHDVSNVIESLLFNSRVLRTLKNQAGLEALATQIHELTFRLANEVRVQKILSRGPGHEALTVHEVSVEQVFSNLVKVFQSHPAARGKTLASSTPPPSYPLFTDANLLERVLMNMLINAFEATAEGGEVRFWVEREPKYVTFCVWNDQPIADDAAQRIFQRNFSTKPENGRGLGTFAMRLLGETYLRGQISFKTSPSDGTQFSFRLPMEPSRDPASSG
jgi:hypothetical protein